MRLALHRAPGARLALAAAAALVLAGCSDDGGAVRNLSAEAGQSAAPASGAGTGSTAGTGSAAAQTGSAPATSATTAQVPAGVVEQYTSAAAEIAASGGETSSGPWRVGYIVSGAEGWFKGTTYREPAAGENVHLEFVPFEAATGRIVPDVPIKVEILSADGAVVDSSELDFYYETFFHYGTNFAIGKPGAYTLRVTLSPPTFLRHGDPAAGPVLSEPVTVTFADVNLGSATASEDSGASVPGAAAEPTDAPSAGTSSGS